MIEFILNIFHFYFSIVYCDNSWDLIKRYFAGKPLIYELRGIKIKTRSRNVRTALVLYEVVVKKVYEQEFSIPKKGKIVDIGANIGEFTVYAASQTKGEVIAVEPEPGNFALLEENIALNKLKNVKAIRAAAAAKPGSVKLYLSKIAEGHSVYNKNKREPFDEYIEVESIPLSDISKSDAALLKIDAEGAEGEIIVESSDKLLQKYSKIVLEYHDNSSKYSAEEIMDKLERVDFKVQRQRTGKYYGYIFAELTKRDVDKRS